MGLGFAERRACCLLRLPGSGREGAGKDVPPELGVRPQESILGLGKWVLASQKGRGALWSTAGRRERRAVAGARGSRAGGVMGQQQRGPWGRKAGEGGLCI